MYTWTIVHSYVKQCETNRESSSKHIRNIQKPQPVEYLHKIIYSIWINSILHHHPCQNSHPSNGTWWWFYDSYIFWYHHHFSNHQGYPRTIISKLLNATNQNGLDTWKLGLPDILVLNHHPQWNCRTCSWFKRIHQIFCIVLHLSPSIYGGTPFGFRAGCLLASSMASCTCATSWRHSVNRKSKKQLIEASVWHSLNFWTVYHYSIMKQFHYYLIIYINR